MTIAFLDSGFTPHPDLVFPTNRILEYHDVTDPSATLEAAAAKPQSWHWHGTQTSVVAAGCGHLDGGKYRGLAPEALVVLVKVSERGRIKEESIAKGLEWVLANHERLGIRIVNISLGGDEDTPLPENRVNQLAEKAVEAGLIVVVAAGNSGGSSAPRPVPPATAPSVITVGGYSDENVLGRRDLYGSSYGTSADGNVKPEIIAPASWVAAPIVEGTDAHREALALSRLAAAPEHELRPLTWQLLADANLTEGLAQSTLPEIRKQVGMRLAERKIVGTAYQNVDGTSFAAPIVSSVIAQLLEAEPTLCPRSVKQILIATADRIQGASSIRQGYGVLHAQRAITESLRDPHLHRCAVGYPPRIDGRRLIFFFHDDGARKVELYGDFRGQMERVAELTRGDDDLWTARLETPLPGRYRYKFIVDGTRWTEDPSHGFKADDGYGGFNSLIHVGWDPHR